MPFCQLFGFHQVGIVDIPEMFWRERRYAFEIERFAFRQRIAYLEVACIVQSHDISGERFVDHLFFLGEKSVRAGEFELFALAYVQVVNIAAERSGYYFDECQAVTVFRVHVGVYFEHESGELFLVRLDLAHVGRF